MKTLVIHPKDYSTRFLKLIYENIPHVLIDDPRYPKSKLRKLIREYERVIILGHGTGKGLASVDRPFFVDSTFVQVLREVPDLTCVWCYANDFVEKYDLKGFYTGMIVSEFGEALDYCIRTTPYEIDYSNELFARLLGAVINEYPSERVRHVKKHYIGNEVITFNWTNIFSR